MPKKKKTKKMQATNTHEFPCTKEALDNVLHDIPIKGMHVICMDQTMKSLTVTLYPNAQHTDTPIVQELEGLPEWTLFQQTLQFTFTI